MVVSKIFKSKEFGWCLFDFANSIAAVNGGIYFAKWYVSDLNAGQISYNILLFTGTLLVLLFGFWIGSSIDKHGYSLWFKLSALSSSLSLCSLFLFSQFLSDKHLITCAFILFLLFIFSYQIARVCQNTFLKLEFSSVVQARLSGYGAAANWLGSIVGILVSIPIISQNPDRFGRESIMLYSAVIYGILTFIALWILLKEKQTKFNPIENSAKYSFRKLSKDFGISLLVFFILFNVMFTVERNLPNYLTEYLQIAETSQPIRFLLILIAAMLGGLLCAKHLKINNSIMMIKIGSLCLFIAILFILSKNLIFHWLSFILAGLSYGVLEASIRVNFLNKIDPMDAGKNFGIYAFLERVSGTIGPLIWIVPFIIFHDDKMGSLFGMIAMGFFTLIAFLILSFYTKTEKSKLF